MAAAPTAVQLTRVSYKAVLIPLATIVTFAFVFGLAQITNRFVRALFGTLEGAVGWIPFFGRVASQSISSIEHKVGSMMEPIILTSERRIGAALHTLSHVASEVAWGIRNAHLLIYELAALLGTFVSYKQWHTFVQSLAGKDRATITKIREHTKAIHANTQTAAHATHTANVAKVRAQAIPADVVLPGDLVGLRERTKAVEDSIGRLWHRVRGLSPAAVAGIGLGALSFALSRLGFGWLKCNNVGRVARRVCGMNPNLLESLLADSLLILGTLSLVELAHAMLAVEDELVHGVRFGFREFSHIATRSAEQQGFVVPG